ncbi:MAG TPA: NAD(P)-dependent oxidoreductase [Allosphingosinicella sp.]|jgi:nucleoside-diphosphate-sugar epimerase
MTRRLVLTGASGLLGTHLLPRLGGWEVHALGRRPPPRSLPNVRWVAADLARPLDDAALPERADAVVYLAQSDRFRDFPEAALDVFEVNLAQLAQMLDYTRRAGASHFIHASSGGVYRRSSRPLTEGSPTEEPSVLGYYAATKLAGEMLAQGYGRSMTIVSLRYFFIYGPGQKRDMLVPRLIDSVRTGAPVSLQGADGIRINPVHAADAAAATAAALDLTDSAAINVAGPEILSLREMGETIGDALGKPPVFEQAEPAAGDLVADTGLMSEALCPPQRRFRDQLGELL